MHGHDASSSTRTFGVGISARQLPLAANPEVVVCGGTVAAVAAALAARQQGLAVLLVAPRLYLGEEWCSTLRLPPPPDDERQAPLLHDILPGQACATPLCIKHTLTRKLIEAEVQVILGCLPVGLLEDAAGAVAGVVVANRAGRQAVAARAIIDATRHGLVVRLLGGTPSGLVPGQWPATRVLLGGEPKAGDGLERLPWEGTDVRGAAVAAYAITRSLPLTSDTPAGWLAWDQRLRDETGGVDCLRLAEAATYDLPPLVSPEASVVRLEWTAVESAGWRAGREAACVARARSVAPSLRVRPAALPVGEGGEGGDLAEQLNGWRQLRAPGQSCPAAADSLPLLAQVEVLVIGGGTAGAAAGIAAARQGKRTLVVEFQEGLGGVGTVGLITQAYHGLAIGFAAEVPFDATPGGAQRKMEWLRRELRQAGGEAWLQTLCFGAWREGQRICGAAVATPYGHGMVRAQVVIDATGNADVAAAAGAPVHFGADAREIASQGTGISTRPLGRDYVNSDYLLVDDGDMVDVTRAVLGSTLALPPDACFDVIPLVQTRERRCLDGMHTLRFLDQLLGRTYPDTVVVSKSDYDSHGYPSLPFFALLPHTETTRTLNHPAPVMRDVADTPWRSLLPQGLENLLVGGLGASMERDASAFMRMQLDLLNQGYAMGLAASLAVTQKVGVRELDVKVLQRQLVALGALPERVLTDRDRGPLSGAELAAAVATYADAAQPYQERSLALATLMANPCRARPLVEEAFADSRGAARLALAKLLGCFGIPSGTADLIQALAANEWDAKINQGQMAEYAYLPTPVDGLVLALGYGGDAAALAPILARLRTLDASVALSHHHSCALALEALGRREAAQPLAALLGKPGMSGHAMLRLEPLPDQPRERRRREGSLREIVLARALWRCGDWEGQGKAILETYRRDMRGYFARHAEAVLGTPTQLAELSSTVGNDQET